MTSVLKNILLGIFFALTTATAFAANVFDVRLAWVSGSTRTDLDLYVKNSSGQIVNWQYRTSTWGATHTRDDHGVARGSSYESFSIDTGIMDCAGGRYTFYIAHYAGPAAASTITAYSDGNSIGSWNFNTSPSSGDREAVYYQGDRSRCSTAQTLNGPTVQTIVEGNDVLALVSFPPSLNAGFNFATQIDVPSNYAVKRVEVLKTASELYNSSLTLISQNAKTQAVWLFSTTAIGFIPVVGDLAAFAAGGSQIALDSAEQLGRANDLYLSQTTRQHVLVNPRNVKMLLWYSKQSGSNNAQPTISTTAMY